LNRLDEAPRWLLGIVAAAHGAVLLGLTFSSGITPASRALAFTETLARFPAAQRFAPPQALQVALVAPPAAAPAPARPAEPRPAPTPRRAAPAPAQAPIPAPAVASDTPARDAAPSTAAVAAAATQAAPAASAVAIVQPPRFDAAYLNNPKPPYPPLARRMGEEGKATLRVLVTPDGLPERIELAESAGSPRLDEAALEAVKHWRFVPARQGETAVAAWVRVPIAFLLEKNR
jgi:protein TonB